MGTYECPIVSCQATHQSSSRFASTVAGETWVLCSGMQSTNNTVAVRYSLDIKYSSADEVIAENRGTCDNRSVVAASAVSRTRIQQAVDASYHQPWPWSGLGVSLVNLPWSLGVMRSRQDA